MCLWIAEVAVWWLGEPQSQKTSVEFRSGKCPEVSKHRTALRVSHPPQNCNDPSPISLSFVSPLVHSGNHFCRTSTLQRQEVAHTESNENNWETTQPLEDGSQEHSGGVSTGTLPLSAQESRRTGGLSFAYKHSLSLEQSDDLQGLLTLEQCQGQRHRLTSAQPKSHV